MEYQLHRSSRIAFTMPPTVSSLLQPRRGNSSLVTTFETSASGNVRMQDRAEERMPRVRRSLFHREGTRAAMTSQATSTLSRPEPGTSPSDMASDGSTDSAKLSDTLSSQRRTQARKRRQADAMLSLCRIPSLILADNAENMGKHCCQITQWIFSLIRIRLASVNRVSSPSAREPPSASTKALSASTRSLPGHECPDQDRFLNRHS